MDIAWPLLQTYCLSNTTNLFWFSVESVKFKRIVKLELVNPEGPLSEQVAVPKNPLDQPRPIYGTNLLRIFEILFKCYDCDDHQLISSRIPKIAFMIFGSYLNLCSWLNTESLLILSEKSAFLKSKLVCNTSTLNTVSTKYLSNEIYIPFLPRNAVIHFDFSVECYNL